MIYFDNAATTFPKPEVVYESMDSFYRNFGVNVGRGQYDISASAGLIVKETRRELLRLFGAKDKQVLFTPSATEGINVVLNSILKADKINVYITPFEHNAVTRTLNYIRKTYQFEEHVLSVNSEYEYDLDEIRQQFRNAPPHVLITTHASNVCGLITPLKDIFAMAKQYDAITIVDAAQTAGLIDISTKDMLIDYLVFPGHKALYGPLGIGGIVCSNNNKLKPIIFGGTGVDSANLEMPSEYPQRIEAGSQNVLAISGLNAALKWRQNTGNGVIKSIEAETRSKLKGILSSYDNIRIVGPNADDKCVNVISCDFDGYSSNEIGKILNDQGIAARTGLQCAPTAHKHLGTFPSGTVRFSPGFFTSESDFEKLDDALQYIYDNS